MFGSCQSSGLDVLIPCYHGVFEGGGSVWQGMNNVLDVAAEAPVVRMVDLRVYSLPGQSALFFVRNFGVAAKVYLIRRRAKRSPAYVAHRRRRPTTTTNLRQVRGGA